MTNGQIIILTCIMHTCILRTRIMDTCIMHICILDTCMHNGYMHHGYIHQGYMHDMKVEKEVVVTFALVTRRPKGPKASNQKSGPPRLLVVYIYFSVLTKLLTGRTKQKCWCQMKVIQLDPNTFLIKFEYCACTAITFDIVFITFILKPFCNSSQPSKEH